MAQLQTIFNKILVLQKGICMIIGLKSRDSVRDNFKGLGIFTDYVKSLQLSYPVKNKHVL